jgi:hypothetical protein
LLLKTVGIGEEGFVILVGGLEIEGDFFTDFISDVDTVDSGLDFEAFSIDVVCYFREVKFGVCGISFEDDDNHFGTFGKMDGLIGCIFFGGVICWSEEIGTRFWTSTLVSFIVAVVDEEGFGEVAESEVEFLVGFCDFDGCSWGEFELFG